MIWKPTTYYNVLIFFSKLVPDFLSHLYFAKYYNDLGDFDWDKRMLCDFLPCFRNQREIIVNKIFFENSEHRNKILYNLAMGFESN